MGLFVRMILYAIGAGAVGYGVGTFDPATGLLTLDLNQIGEILAGALTFLGTFAASRVVKAKGGNT